MRKGAVGLFVLIVIFSLDSHAQVDTSYVYNTSTPYGTLDIRIARSSSTYYYLQDGRTLSFRESGGVPTNTYRDMTSFDSSPYGQGNMRLKSGTSDSFVMNYRLMAPLNYNASYSPGYPLIVFLHGAGERGNCWMSTCYHADPSYNPNTNTPAAPTTADSKLLNNDHNLLHGGSVHIQMRNAANGRLPNDPTMPARSFPGFVLFPQNLNGWNGSSVQDAIKLVRLIAKKYNIDENRIYIQGLSNGGYAVYEAIKRAPWLFASAVAMSAVSDAAILNQNLQSSTAHIPLSVYQGGQDTNPSPAKTEGYVKKFREAGAIVKYKLYPTLGHGTWNSAFKESDFFKWMLLQNKSNIHSFAGSTKICQTNGQGVRMELAAGFRAYQWEKDGVIIAGATSNKYTATTTGTYRARFSRVPSPGASDWNQWSAPVVVGSVNPATPVVNQVGTVILKDLNGLNDARLKAATGFAKYLWYKNGASIGIGDSVTEPVIKSTSGNGTYTLVVSGFDNCPSPASKPKYIFFNDSAPINLPSPTGFSAAMASANTVRLTWGDASSGEVGFEIWRRKQTGTTFTPWEMRTITATNATSYNDLADPSTTYNYKIRAAGSSGRSDYSPSSSTLNITTTADTQAPTTPGNLVATQAGIQAIKLTWAGSTDNTGIKQYRIYYGATSVATGSNLTNHTLTNLPLNASFNFTVKAEDLGGNLSAASNTASQNTYVNGLFYKHTTGAWTDLDEINWNATPEFTGKVTTFTLGPRTQEDYFNIEFDGFLYINTAGTYYFQATSSDGSRITLNGAVIVDNDGIHASRTITSAAVNLGSGAQKINVKYFEFDESHVLTIKYKGPDTGNNFVTVPSTALKSGTAPSATTMEAASTESGRMATSTVSVYPNPTTENDINVQMESDDSAPVSVQVMDFTGRRVFEGVFNMDEINQGIRVLPRERMRDGIYLLLIKQNGKTTQQRISIKNQ
jgi:hypothetical protein